MDPSQPQPEPITATAVVPPPPTTEPTTHHSQTTSFPAAVNGGAARSAKRDRGRPRKNQAQPTESKPVVLGLSANRTPLLPILPAAAVTVTDSSKKRRERLSKVSVVQSAAPDAHYMVPTKSELAEIGGSPGELPEKRRGRPAGGEPKKKTLKNVSQHGVAPQPTVVNFDCEILQKKMEMMKSRIKEVVGVLKPQISAAENPSSSAMAAILELELIAMDSRPSPLIDLNLHPDS